MDLDHTASLHGPRSGALAILRYTVARAAILLTTVAATVYITIIVANFGGHIDESIRANIDFGIGMSMRGMQNVTTEERDAIFEERRQAAYEAAGLNTPFVERCFRWLGRGLTLDWGETQLGPTGRWGGRGREIRAVILESLPRSLLIFGTSNLLLFFVTVFAALPLTNKQVGWLDKLIITLSPLSSAPAWVYGVVLNLLALRTVGGVLSGGAFDAWPDEFKLAYVPMLLRHLVLPILSIFLSGLFQGVYTWRMYFQLHANEDYVALAKAKGLRPRTLQRRYILRPILPSLITSFALLFVNLWQEVIILESYFDIAGIGQLFAKAISFNAPNRTPVIVALVVTFAYLLAITVFVLDIAYAVVDPRIRVAGQGSTVRARSSKRKGRTGWFRQRAKRDPGARPAADRPRGIGADPTADSDIITGERGPQESVQPQAARSRGTSAKPRWRRRLLGCAESLTLALRQLARYPTAVIGLLAILGLIATSIYAVIAIPYDEMLVLWREGEETWVENPRNAWPAWINHFRKSKLPDTIVIDSRLAADSGGIVERTIEVISEEMTEISLSFPFDYQYDALPQDVAIAIEPTYDEKRPLVTLTWVTPDGREIPLMSKALGLNMIYRVSQDEKLPRKLGTEDPLEALLTDPGAQSAAMLKGAYELRLSAYVFEEDADVDAKLILYGQVFGVAGTDSRRRDLRVPLLWGLSVAMAFGLLAAVGTTVTSVLIAAVGTWFGGWADILVQRITEVNIILPFLPVSIMVYVLYSKSIWMILGVTVLLSIFGSSIKDYRALLLQIRESPYIEAAKSYGASNWRIIVHYLIPRIISVVVPKVVILVPSYVFLEASLAFLGISDPVLPTWGKLIVDGLERGFYSENYHLILEPLGCLMLVGFAFVMLGVSLERVFNTKLRQG